MADKQRTVKRKEKKEKDTPEAEQLKDVKKGKAPAEGEKAVANGEAADVGAANGEVANGENGEEVVEKMELPPFEIITGDRIDPFFYKFQYKNVEYSSGRNKTFLCYLIDKNNEFAKDGVMRGYLEDEHSGAHSEEAFWIQTLPDYEPSLKYTVVWYVSSSPCAACAHRIAEVLKARTALKLTIFMARLWEWEEPAIQEGLRAMHAAGCKLRVMKPLDFAYTWDTFVEHDEQPLNLWEDCKDNTEYYQEKLAEILD